MGRDPKGSYNNEMDFLNGLTNLLIGRGGSETIPAYGILSFIKNESACKFKIKTIKIALVLENDVHMHKDIDFEGL